MQKNRSAKIIIIKKMVQKKMLLPVYNPLLSRAFVLNIRNEVPSWNRVQSITSCRASVEEVVGASKVVCVGKRRR